MKTLRTITHTVEKDFSGEKLLTVLRVRLGLSLTLVRRLKRSEKGILLNGAFARTIDIVKEGDIVEINIPFEEKEKAELDIPLDIVFEDEDLLIINKPAGIAMHESHNHQGDSLSNAVYTYMKRKGKSCLFRSVGRLDKGTTGLVICALNSHAASKLAGKYEKTYLALVKGKFQEDGEIEKPIFRPDPMKTRRTCDERGDYAKTVYEVLEYKENYSLLKIRLLTGRTHQIRVHFASLGCPLFGDTMYGTDDKDIHHQALHCDTISFTHPVTEEKLTLSCPMPREMEKTLLRLRAESSAEQVPMKQTEL